VKTHATLLPSETVFVDAVVEKGNRCHVHVLDLYLHKLPPEAFEKNVFYLQPVVSFTDPAKPWFTTNPVGKNSLNRMIKEICADAGIDDQCYRASENEPTDPTSTPPPQQAQIAPPHPLQVAMIPRSLVSQALFEAQQRNTAHQQPAVTQIQATTIHQQPPPLVHTTHPTHNTTHANTTQEPAVSQSSQTSTNSPQHTAMSIQGVTPHNFIFHNCSVNIYVTPSQPQPESHV
jgi:hypothetical protein